LTGKGCNLKNLDLFISEKLKIPVYLVAPFFSSVTWGKFITGFEYTSCFGALVQDNKQLNIIPKSLKVEKLYKKRTKLLLLLCLFLLLLLGTYSINLNTEKNRFENTVSNMYTEYEDLFISEKKYEEMLIQKKELDNKIIMVNNTLRKDSKIEDILKIISNATHENIVLSSIEYNNGELSKPPDSGKKNDDVIIIKGNVYKNFLSADITLLRFISALESYQYFKSVTLVEEKKQIKEQIFLFKIQLEI
jgi:hypothetical protein